MSHPNGYTKEMIKEILGTSWPDPPGESGNEMRKRKGREMRAGKIPYPTYSEKKVGPQFDENGKYIYPPGSGFNYMDYVNSSGKENNKVS